MTLQTLALGRRGEALAADTLAQHGFTILARNWRCPYGEADLIALEADRLVIVEVKTSTVGTIQPEAHVTRHKLRRLENILACFAKTERRRERGLRIDVVAIQVDRDGGLHRYTHMRNAYL
jgi:putative endonuclease